MIHLPALPGSYAYSGEDLEKILEEARRDLDILQSGGVDGVIVENFGDAPFAKYAPKETVAAMTVIVSGIVRAAKVPVGVNVLRNDGVAAISIAAATGARSCG